MKITEIRYERKLSDGNYGSEGISITGSGEGLDPIKEGERLKLIVEAQLFGPRWLKEYTNALAVLNDSVMHDQTDQTYNDAKMYVINYDAWYARVQAALDLNK